MKNKRWIYLFIGLIILIAGVFIITAAVDKTKQWHSAATNIKIVIDGSEKTLQQAINEDLFTGSHTYSSPSAIPSGGHKADAIWVSVGGTENNLIQALSSTGICANTPTSSYTGPTDKSKAYHYATEIEVTVDGSAMSLQDAIDSGKWCYGWILVPGNSALGTSDFLVMKYEAKNVNGKPVSQEALTPWTNLYFNNAKTACESLGSGYHLLTNAEWMTIAKNIESTPASWTGGAVGNGMIKRGNVGTDDAGSYNGADPEYGTGRNTKAELKLSTGASIWDFSGNADEWVNGMCSPGVGANFWTNADNGYKEWTYSGFADLERAEAGPSTSIDYGSNPSSKGAGIADDICLYDNNRFSRGGMYVSRTYGGIFSVSVYEITATYGNPQGFRSSWTGFRCAKTFDEYTYSWDAGSWSSCTNNNRARTVSCKRNDGTQVADSYCTGTKPPSSQACWEGQGCNSCPWGFSQPSGDIHKYCKVNGRQGSWYYTIGTPYWKEWTYQDQSGYTGAHCGYGSSTTFKWRIID